jgi:hypothetical protein
MMTKGFPKALCACLGRSADSFRDVSAAGVGQTDNEKRSKKECKKRKTKKQEETL